MLQRVMQFHNASDSGSAVVPAARHFATRSSTRSSRQTRDSTANRAFLSSVAAQVASHTWLIVYKDLYILHVLISVLCIYIQICVFYVGSDRDPSTPGALGTTSALLGPPRPAPESTPSYNGCETAILNQEDCLLSCYIHKLHPTTIETLSPSKPLYMRLFSGACLRLNISSEVITNYRRPRCLLHPAPKMGFGASSVRVWGLGFRV